MQAILYAIWFALACVFHTKRMQIMLHNIRKMQPNSQGTVTYNIENSIMNSMHFATQFQHMFVAKSTQVHIGLHEKRLHWSCKFLATFLFLVANLQRFCSLLLQICAHKLQNSYLRIFFGCKMQNAHFLQHTLLILKIGCQGGRRKNFYSPIAVVFCYF